MSINWSLAGQWASGGVVLGVLVALAYGKFTEWRVKRASLKRLHALLVACDNADIERDSRIAQAITDAKYRVWRRKILADVVADDQACAFQLDADIPFPPYDPPTTKVA